jgi:hypothetical protein
VSLYLAPIFHFHSDHIDVSAPFCISPCLQVNFLHSNASFLIATLPSDLF